MEEIKLPKFKTKDELEEFVIGLITENESLKNLIKYKDLSITELNKNVLENTHLNYVLLDTKMENKKLKEENEELKKKCDNIDYKKEYELLKDWKDEENELRIRMLKENLELVKKNESLENSRFNLARTCRSLVNMMPFYKRKVAQELVLNIL